MTLSGGAIGREIGHIALGGPANRVHETIKKRIRRGKRKGILKVRIKGDGGEILRLKRQLRFDLGVAEAGDREAGLVRIEALFAKIIDFLPARHLLGRRLEIRLGELAFLGEHLAQLEDNSFSAFLGGQLKSDDASDILAKIKNLRSFRSDNELGFEALVGSDQRII